MTSIANGSALILLVATVAGASASCRPSKSTDDLRSKSGAILPGADALAPSGRGGAPNVSEPSAKPVVDPLPSSQPAVATGFDVALRVKSLQQLRSAIEACIGRDMTVIDASMILPADGSLPPSDPLTGRAAFLDSERYSPGEDVLAKEGAFLLDPARSERFGTDADQLSAPYLRAVETVANVVAHKCTTTTCDCSTDLAANAMIRRCLPGLDPAAETFVAATRALTERCRQTPGGVRSAIASLLASYAFVVKN